MGAKEAEKITKSEPDQYPAGYAEALKTEHLAYSQTDSARSSAALEELKLVDPSAAKELASSRGSASKS